MSVPDSPLMYLTLTDKGQKFTRDGYGMSKPVNVFHHIGAYCPVNNILRILGSVCITELLAIPYVSLNDDLTQETIIDVARNNLMNVEFGPKAYLEEPKSENFIFETSGVYGVHHHVVSIITEEQLVKEHPVVDIATEHQFFPTSMKLDKMFLQMHDVRCEFDDTYDWIANRVGVEYIQHMGLKLVSQVGELRTLSKQIKAEV